MSLRRTSLLALLLCLTPAWASAQTTCTSLFSGADQGLVGTDPETLNIGSVTAGHAIFGIWRASTDETHTVTVSDNVNGSGYTMTGPFDDGGGTARTYMFHFLNSAAGTVTVSADPTAIQGGFWKIWTCAPASPFTFEEFPSASIQASSVTSHPSPTANASCSAGTVIGALFVNSARTTTFDGATVKIDSVSALLHPIYIPFTSSGNINVTGTSSTAARSIFYLGVFCESSAATPRNGTLLGVLP